MPTRKIIAFLMSPVAVILWIVGWSLYRVTDKKMTVRPKHAEKEKNLAFDVFVPEVQIEA